MESSCGSSRRGSCFLCGSRRLLSGSCSMSRAGPAEPWSLNTLPGDPGSTQVPRRMCVHSFQT
eukprot:217114-Alexandrium_andersonii.AAC.1